LVLIVKLLRKRPAPLGEYGGAGINLTRRPAGYRRASRLRLLAN